MTIPLFPPSSKYVSLLTGGALSFAPSATPIAFQGMSTDASPAPAKPSAPEIVRSAPASAVGAPVPGTILDGFGRTVPVSAAFNPSNAQLQSTQADNIYSASDPRMAPSSAMYQDRSYTGSDLRVLLEIANPVNGRFAKQLIELTTLTVSVHRVKSPAVAMGFINAKGWARGRRTVAGTLVLTKFSKDVLSEFLTPEAFTADVSKDSASLKADQLPPFNLTLLFADEFGQSSYQRILGMELVTSGDIYSIQDLYSEQTLTYVAADFTPLLPYTQKVLNPILTPATAIQRTVGDVLNRGSVFA